MTNRNPCKQWFLTFPQTEVSKQDFLDTLQLLEVDYWNVVQEHHKDGSLHLHAILRLRSRRGNTLAQLLKFFQSKYPNDWKRIHLKPVRSIHNAIEYLSKEDCSPLVSGDYVDARDPAKARRQANLDKISLWFYNNTHMAVLPFEEFQKFILENKSLPQKDDIPNILNRLKGNL